MNVSDDNIDIDSNFLNDNYLGLDHGQTNDSFFDSEKFNRIYTGNHESDLKIIHLNIRSLPRNGDAFIAYLALLKHRFDIICFTETWLNESRIVENLFPDYVQYNSMRSSDSPYGGGASVFIHKKFNSCEVTELSCNLDHIECVFTKVSLFQKDLYVASCYRKPEQSLSSQFINDLNEKISSLPSSSNIIIAGDFNFNLFETETNPHAASFLDSLFSLGLIPTITNATRDFSNSVSLLDNIFVSNIIAYNSGIFAWDVSDHFPVFSFLKDFLLHNNSSESVRRRLLNEIFLDNFSRSIAIQDFSQVLQSDDLDFAVEKLNEIILTQYNAHCPVFIRKIDKRDREKPWIRPDIKQLLRMRQVMYRDFKLNRLTFDEFKQYRNYVTCKLREAKKLYFQNIFNEMRGNMKKMWTVINGLVKPGLNRNNNLIKSLLINGVILDDPTQVCNILNEHFSTVGSKISAEFGQSDHVITSNHSVANSLFFKLTQPQDILKIIDNLKNKPCNIDNYSNKAVKAIKFILSPILSHLINKSLLSAYFPKSLKVARVVPLHKGGLKDEVNNYRPISVLPLISKIFERIIYNQLYNFLEKYKILCDNQFGFRKKRSTVQAVLDLLNFVYRGLDRSDAVISVFMDFSKAFDCLDHDILLKKLFNVGVRGLPHQLFKSYLSNRVQYVSVNNSTSDIMQITHGVPQGSILGPLLFLIFINDFPSVSSFFKFSLFADDSTLTCAMSNKNEDYIKAKLESELKPVFHWLKINKIKTNYDKSKFIIFSYGKKYSLESLNFGNSLISKTSTIKFLGIHMDENLNFKTHCSLISNKISKVIGLLFRLNSTLPCNALTTLYSALLLPHILYGVEVWHGVLQSNDDRIFKLQKKAIRAINCLTYNAHTNEYFKNMNLLKLNDIYKSKVLTYMFNSIETFPTNADTHLYNTRHSNDLSIPRCYRARTQSTIFYKGVGLWNDLPEDIRSMQSVGAFKLLLKVMLIAEY